MGGRGKSYFRGRGLSSHFFRDWERVSGVIVPYFPLGDSPKKDPLLTDAAQAHSLNNRKNCSASPSTFAFDLAGESRITLKVGCQKMASSYSAVEFVVGELGERYKCIVCHQVLFPAQSSCGHR